MARPRIYNGTHRRIMASLIKKHGLTGALPVLHERGINCSVAVLRDVAKEKGIELKRGRRVA